VVSWIPNGRGIAQESALYNFNLKIGDTIAVYRHMTTFYHYVQSVDSIILKDGIKRKQANIYSKNIGELGVGEKVNSWVEGLGDFQYGLIYPFCQQSFAPRCLDGLICYKEASNVKYEFFPLACYTTSILNKASKFDINIFPNPFHDILYIDSPSIKKVLKVSIYNVLGKIMFHKESNYYHECKIEIDLRSLHEGIYFLELSNNDYKVLKTIIKK
jgi:hypothetical protein